MLIKSQTPAALLVVLAFLALAAGCRNGSDDVDATPTGSPQATFVASPTAFPDATHARIHHSPGGVGHSFGLAARSHDERRSQRDQTKHKIADQEGVVGTS